MQLQSCIRACFQLNYVLKLSKTFKVKNTLAFLLPFLLLACGSDKSPQDVQETTPSEPLTEAATGETIYQTYCTGCHGADLNGGSAGPLLKNEWTYGHTRGLMIRNVTFGIPGTEMGAFEELLTGDQIRAVVDYVREAQDAPPGREKEIPALIETRSAHLEVEQIAEEGLSTPWAIEFINEKKALISERDGQLRWLINNKLDPRPIEGTPVPHTGSSTGGYMDIALDPNYAETGWVYLSYSHSNGDYENREAPATTKIVRGKIREYEWVQEQTLFEAPDSLWVVDGNRWGCRFLFDGEGHLFFSVGDMGKAMDSQDPRKVTGKVFRIHPDGSIPKDNPFVGESGALGAVYSLGNRNVQGIAMHPVTGEIWASEHGPMGGDELNILQKGANYGWPVITYGRGYGGETVSEKTHQEGMEQPAHQWTPSIAVCPIEFVESPQFPEWENNLLVGALAFEELRRYEVKNGKILSEEMIFKGMGRVRDIKVAPDGSVFVVLNGPDLLLRLSRAGQLLK